MTANGRATWTIGGLVGIAAAVVTMWMTIDPWPKWGWQTPTKHQADIANISTTIQVFRDEWRCQKYGEELADLYRELDEHQTRRLEDQIADQRDKMDETNCIRFQRY